VERRRAALAASKALGNVTYDYQTPTTTFSGSIAPDNLSDSRYYVQIRLAAIARHGDVSLTCALVYSDHSHLAYSVDRISCTTTSDMLPINRVYYDNCANVNTVRNRELITAPA
jgi:hypothetical protein